MAKSGVVTARSRSRLLRMPRAWHQLPVVMRYALAAGVTQVLYLTALALGLAAELPYVAAIAVAQVIAIAYAFPVYRRQVFDVRGEISRQFATFLGVWWSGAAMSFVGVPLLVELAHLGPFTAQVLVLLAVFSYTFAAHAGLTFRGPRGGVSVATTHPEVGR
jgi:putative flippase GtrA